MLHVRHRTASGRLDELWEFDSARRVIEVVMRLGSARPLAFTVPVCAIDNPRLDAYAVARLDGESWKILPARFVIHGGKFVPMEIAVHPSLEKGTLLVLTNAPADVDAELQNLSL